MSSAVGWAESAKPTAKGAFLRWASADLSPTHCDGDNRFCNAVWVEPLLHAKPVKPQALLQQGAGGKPTFFGIPTE